ncbi:MAG: D-2-hydroxyacid dehydrogenase family protein [Alphaproteobacteria bacterium]|nr:D-2-hydroxyacid dehydrogenase family protein [Alphaproteobacteria bacterium]
MRLAILDDFQNIVKSIGDWSRIEDRVDVTVYNDHLEDKDALVERLEPFDIAFVIRERSRFPKDVLERLPNLKLLITAGMRNRSIDVAAAEAQGITVCGTGGSGNSTAELTFGLILCVMRNIPEQVQSIRDGGWQIGLGVGLMGKTLGIIGLGRQGSAVAKIGKGFDMDIVAWSRSLTQERCAEHGARLAKSLEALLAQSDVVTIHVPLTDSSRGLIGARELSHLKKSAYMINTSRGPILEEAALIDAVKSGRIAGAGLDVFDIEPLPADHPYRTLSGIVPTPHLGYTALENYQCYCPDVIENIDAFLKGDPVRVIKP